jgi:hypothetical protein
MVPFNQANYVYVKTAQVTLQMYCGLHCQFRRAHITPEIDTLYVFGKIKYSISKKLKNI